MKKKNLKAKSVALHSAFNHDFFAEDINLTYAFDEKVLKKLNVELAIDEEFEEKNRHQIFD